MTTRETMQNLPENIRAAIEVYKADYNKAEKNSKEREKIGAGILYYCRALRDAGIVTDSGHRQIYTYATL